MIMTCPTVFCNSHAPNYFFFKKSNLKIFSQNKMRKQSTLKNLSTFKVKFLDGPFCSRGRHDDGFGLDFDFFLDLIDVGSVWIWIL